MEDYAELVRMRPDRDRAWGPRQGVPEVCRGWWLCFRLQPLHPLSAEVPPAGRGRWALGRRPHAETAPAEGRVQLRRVWVEFPTKSGHGV